MIIVRHNIKNDTTLLEIHLAVNTFMLLQFLWYAYLVLQILTTGLLVDCLKCDIMVALCLLQCCQASHHKNPEPKMILHLLCLTETTILVQLILP